MSKPKKTLWFENDRPESDFKTRVIRSGGISVFAQTVAYGAQTIGTIIMARLLSPNDFGLVAFVTVASLLLMNFGVKFSEAIIQENRITHALISNTFWANLIISTGLALSLIAVSPLLAWFFKEPQVKEIALVMAIIVVLPAISTQHTALLKRKMNFRAIAAMDISASLISVITGIVLALRGFGYWAIIARQIAFYSIGSLSAWYICNWRPGLYDRGTSLKAILKFTVKTYGNYCLTYFCRSLDKILIGRYFGSQMLGHYDRAYNLSSAFPNQLITPLTGVAISTLSKLRNSPDKFVRYYENMVSLIAFVSMGVSVVLTVIGRDLVVLALGQQWEIAGRIFVAFAAGMGISLIYSTTMWVHISLGRADRALKWSLLSSSITVIIIVSGLAFGVMGVAIAYSLSSFMLVVPAFRYAMKPISTQRFSYWGMAGKHVLSAFVAGVLSWLLMYTGCLSLLGSFASARGIRILIVLMVCSALYLSLEIAFHRGLKPLISLIEIAKIMNPMRHSK